MTERTEMFRAALLIEAAFEEGLREGYDGEAFEKVLASRWPNSHAYMAALGLKETAKQLPR